MECGARLTEKYHEQEKKMIPWCPVCGDWRFPVFSTAVSMLVMNADKSKILLIKQYGRDSFILVAGYVNHGEDAVAEHWAERLRAEGYEADAPYNGSVWIAAEGRVAWASRILDQKLQRRLDDLDRRRTPFDP